MQRVGLGGGAGSVSSNAASGPDFAMARTEPGPSPSMPMPPDAAAQPVLAQPLPNLRNPAHAALREQLRTAIAALGPLDVHLQLRLAEPDIRAGEDLPVELTLRNDGTRTIPARLLDHQALSIGFRLAGQAGDGLRRVGEPRWPAPPDGLPPGTTITLRAKLPTAQLAAGQYEVSADLVYEYVRWFRKDETTRPRAPFRVVGAGEEPHDPADPRTFLAHVPSLNPSFDNGIEAIGDTRFRIRQRGGEIKVRSMLHEHEVALLHMLASRALQGRGDIADLGPLLGVGTCAMARGLSANPDPAARARRIVSYDMWRLGFARSFLASEVPAGSPDDFPLQPLFESTVADELDRIVRMPGDLAAQHWIGGPIELIFVDLAKSVPLMEHIARVFYPALVPGAWIVHQDFVHPDCWWLHVATGLMLDRLEYLYSVPGSSALFRLREGLPACWSLPPIAPMPLAEKRAAIGQVRAVLRPGGEQMMMDLVEACCLLDHGEAEEAGRWAARVDPARCAAKDPFRRILTSTSQQMLRRLRKG